MSISTAKQRSENKMVTKSDIFKNYAISSILFEDN